MQDRELYRQILGIESPWKVVRVELRRADGEVHVFLEHDEQVRWPCRQCSAVCALHDHQPERRWRHLDTCQYRTILHARPPRSDCSEHGPRVVRLPWAEASSRFTALFEALAISWLKEASQQGIAELLALSWDEIHGILERGVQRGLERRAAEPIPYLGVDEKSFRKRHRYLTVVNDLNCSRVLFVAEGRRQASLDGFWKTLSAEQLARVEAVAMDMWDPYVASTREHLDESEKKIVYDKYHIAAHLAKAVDQVRRAENKRLLALGDERLTGTKYAWLRHPANFSEDAWREFPGRTRCFNPYSFQYAAGSELQWRAGVGSCPYHSGRDGSSAFPLGCYRRRDSSGFANGLFPRVWLRLSSRDDRNVWGYGSEKRRLVDRPVGRCSGGRLGPDLVHGGSSADGGFLLSLSYELTAVAGILLAGGGTHSGSIGRLTRWRCSVCLPSRAFASAAGCSHSVGDHSTKGTA